MFPSVCFNAHFELSVGRFWLVRKRVNANNGRWKRICQINSSKCIKNILWFAGWDSITWQTSGPISLHSIWNVVMVIPKCLSKVCRQSIPVQFPSELSYTTAFPNSRHPPLKAMTTLIVLCLLTLSNLLYSISQKWVHPSHFCKYFIISFHVTTLTKLHFATMYSLCNSVNLLSPQNNSTHSH